MFQNELTHFRGLIFSIASSIFTIDLSMDNSTLISASINLSLILEHKYKHYTLNNRNFFLKGTGGDPTQFDWQDTPEDLAKQNVPGNPHGWTADPFLLGQKNPPDFSEGVQRVYLFPCFHFPVISIPTALYCSVFSARFSSLVATSMTLKPSVQTYL